MEEMMQPWGTEQNKNENKSPMSLMKSDEVRVDCNYSTYVV